jgi:Protein of unknown function (DUF1552)
MKKKPLHRRTVLRGLLAAGGAATIPLPLLEIMLNNNGTALAQSNTPLATPYVTWFFGNGVLPGRWKPAVTGSGSAWSLSPLLQPLASFKSHLSVVSGLENKCVVAGIEHPSGSAGATTGAGLGGNAVRAKSIDQIVADTIAEGTDFRSLEVGVTPATPNGPQDSLHTVSHNGPNGRNDAEYDPAKVFSRLFTSGTNTPPTGGTEDPAAKLATVRRSVLDACLEDGAALQRRLGTADKLRVENHLESIRAIETRLQAIAEGGGGGVVAACQSPVSPTSGPDMRSEAPPGVNTAMAQLSALALACERTRVLNFMFSLPAAHVYYRHLASDMNDDFHDTICHGDAGTESDQPRVEKGVLYAMTCLNELLTEMNNTAFGASTLLDASLILVTSDTAWGKIHTRVEWPALLIGKAGGLLKGDVHQNYPGDNLSKVLFTAAKIMGSPVSDLGLDGGKVSETLGGLLA